MPISRIETNSIASSQTLTTPIIATTMGVGGATPAGSGSGITFPAAQSASTDVNTLDDYEEGTFTPTVTFGGGATGVTYYYQVGRYVKVGKMVSVNIHLYIANKGSSTGGMTVSGLPFTSDSGTANDYYLPLGTRAGYTLTSGSLPFAFLSSSSTALELYQTGTTGGSAAQLNNSNVATASEMNLNFCYQVA